jgi:hypothetical protein
MHEHVHAGMSLYGSAGSRKYLNAAERRRFAKAARRAPLEIQLFCLVLSLSGGRISEILALTPAAIDLDSGVANITTLKRRRRGIVRQVRPPASQRDRQTRPGLSSSTAPTRSRFSLSADLEMEPNNRMAASEGGHDSGRRKPCGSDAKRTSTRLRGQRYREPRTAASDSAMARPCLTEDDGDLLRRLRPGRTCVCNSDVERIRLRSEQRGPPVSPRIVPLRPGI